MLNRFKSVW